MNQINILLPYQIRIKAAWRSNWTYLPTNYHKKVLTMPKSSHHFCNSLFSIQLYQITSFSSYWATEMPLQNYNIMPWPLSGVNIRNLNTTTFLPCLWRCCWRLCPCPLHKDTCHELPLELGLEKSSIFLFLRYQRICHLDLPLAAKKLKVKSGHGVRREDLYSGCCVFWPNYHPALH